MLLCVTCTALVSVAQPGDCLGLTCLVESLPEHKIILHVRPAEGRAQLFDIPGFVVVASPQHGCLW